MSTDDKTYVADERMQKFFTKLLDLKKFVRDEVEKTQDKTLKQILDRLDTIIQEGK